MRLGLEQGYPVLVNAVIDTSFLIDWVKYSRNRLLFKLFEVVFIPESVLLEVRSESTITWISRGLEEGVLAILPELPDISRLALDLVTRSRRVPIRPVDYPEAYCLVIGRIFGYTVLTENGGAVALKDYDPEYSDVEVLRGIDVLYRLWKRNLIDSFREELERYQNETKHLYSRRDTERYRDAL